MNITEKNIEDIEKIYNIYGEQTQVEQTIKEANKLINAILHETIGSQIQEIADNFNMLMHMMVRISKALDIAPSKIIEMVEKARLTKVDSQFQRIDRGRLANKPQKSSNTILYRNKKNNESYQLLDFALTNATNKVENQQMILYRPLSENALYCREYSEFMEKFEKI